LIESFVDNCWSGWKQMQLITKKHQVKATHKQERMESYDGIVIKVFPI
jgi:hypothetical protein